MYTAEKNKYMPRMKSHVPCRASNHKSLCALGQNLHAQGTRARLYVEPSVRVCGVREDRTPLHPLPWQSRARHQ